MSKESDFYEFLPTLNITGGTPFATPFAQSRRTTVGAEDDCSDRAAARREGRTDSRLRRAQPAL
jgi:hypothetical protein